MTNKMVKALNNPEILIDLQPEAENPCCINLCIQNIGTGAASELTFEGDLSFIPTMPKLESLSERGILKHGIDFLGPGENLQFTYFTLSICFNMSMEQIDQYWNIQLILL